MAAAAVSSGCDPDLFRPAGYPGSVGSELLERDREVAGLDRAVGHVLSGWGGVVVIEGPAGCGKTRLLDEARSRAAAAGLAVLPARAGELERDFPFGVARQLFEGVLAGSPEDERRELLEGAAGLSLRALGVDVPEGRQEPAALFPVLHGLYWLTANLAERSPLMLVIDDLQWVDTATLRWLGYLVARIEGLPVLITTALRSGEPHPDPTLVEAVTAGEAVQVLRPGPLGVGSVATLVEELLGRGDELFARACHGATAGNPFLLSELLRALAADAVVPGAAAATRVSQMGPSTVSRSVFLRLARLAAGADRLAGAVAVLGLDAELRHTAALAGLSEVSAARAADALVSSGLLAPGRPLEFVHPIVRASIYNELPTEQLALAHRQAAHLLARDGADAQRIAAHLRRSRPAADPETVTLLQRAARAASAQGATAEAIADLRRALEEPPAAQVRGEVLLQLGRAERLAGDAEAIAHLEDAAETIEEPGLRAEVLRELSRACTFAGRPQDVVMTSDQAAQALEGGSRGVTSEIEAELIAAGQMGMLPGYSVTERLTRLSPDLVDATTPGGRMLHAVMAFEAVRRARPSTEAVALAEIALSHGAEREPVADSIPRYLALLALLYADAFDRVHERCDEELTGVRNRGSPSELGNIALIQADLAFRRGRLADADGHASTVPHVEGAENAIVGAFALAVRLQCMLERGAHADAAALLSASGVSDLPPELLLHSLLLARANVKIASGDLRAGLDDLEACGRLMTAAGFQNSAPVPWRPTAALACVSLGMRSEAERLAEEELVSARAFGAPRALGMALRAAGLVRGGPVGIDLLHEAVATLSASQARLEHARALTDRGAALRRAGHRTDARSHLSHALEIADTCQATAIAGRAQEELLAAGARPRRRAQSGPQSLTPTEHRVAQLAGSGLSNREIAQTLFVTVKTVETHLRHVYTKLDISSRAGLSKELNDREPDVGAIADTSNPAPSPLGLAHEEQPNKNWR